MTLYGAMNYGSAPLITELAPTPSHEAHCGMRKISRSLPPILYYAKNTRQKLLSKEPSYLCPRKEEEVEVKRNQPVCGLAEISIKTYYLILICMNKNSANDRSAP